MKRYLAFKFPEYYPGGGWEDLVGSYDSITEAESALGYMEWGDNGQVVDLKMGVVVSRFGRPDWPR